MFISATTATFNFHVAARILQDTAIGKNYAADKLGQILVPTLGRQANTTVSKSRIEAAAGTTVSKSYKRRSFLILEFPFSGLTAGDGFVCGLLLDSKQPYCWGNGIYIQMGVPHPMAEEASYSEISAGVHHICELRLLAKRMYANISMVGLREDQT
ncbi:serine/threonine-protein kinase-like protein CCR1 isoform X1 [Magnolia sinica]|uniref:serine/threonine-protein kinase-like protein CCR1 isoform X1 n=1 Tax=Magnolia sinica TaxID=86752 RepID=UPI002659470B|nr:serine/threonine-protein kinase-like protein CCR1 isoform X1 [Magnolia sinica]